MSTIKTNIMNLDHEKKRVDLLDAYLKEIEIVQKEIKITHEEREFFKRVAVESDYQRTLLELSILEPKLKSLQVEYLKTLKNGSF